MTNVLMVRELVKDSIRLKVVKDYIKASNSTLGLDCVIGEIKPITIDCLTPSEIESLEKEVKYEIIDALYMRCISQVMGMED